MAESDWETENTEMISIVITTERGCVVLSVLSSHCGCGFYCGFGCDCGCGCGMWNNGGVCVTGDHDLTTQTETETETETENGTESRSETGRDVPQHAAAISSACANLWEGLGSETGVLHHADAAVG